MEPLQESTALVTGAGSGIGRAIARRLTTEGATVAVNDVDADAAAETVEIIRDAGGRALPAVADVTDLKAVASAVDDVLSETGTIEVLVNNAGWDEFGLFLEQEPEIWDRIIDINYRGQLHCSRVVATHMIKEDVSGSIVNIASDAGRVGSFGEGVYAGTKGAVIAFSKTLARELARYDVTCNVVAPGLTETPLTDRVREESDLAGKAYDRMEEQIPLGRPGTPEDIAGAVAFFASDDTGYVTGQVLSVSGGLTMVD